jgi:hypothetical protein
MKPTYKLLLKLSVLFIVVFAVVGEYSSANYRMENLNRYKDLGRGYNYEQISSEATSHGLLYGFLWASSAVVISVLKGLRTYRKNQAEKAIASNDLDLQQ